MGLQESDLDLKLDSNRLRTEREKEKVVILRFIYYFKNFGCNREKGEMRIIRGSGLFVA